MPEAKIQEDLQSLTATHGLRLQLITLYQGSPFARHLSPTTQAFLQDPAPTMSLVVWTESHSLTYHHCQVQVNEALATRLP